MDTTGVNINFDGAVVTRNLLRNGSLEEGNTAAWNVLGPGTTNIAAYKNSAVAKEGEWYGETNISQASGSIYQDVAVEPKAGESYTFSMWVRSTGGPADVNLALWATGGNQQAGNARARVGNAWTLLVVPLDVRENGHGNIRAQLYMDTTGVNINFDGGILGWRPRLGTIANTSAPTITGSPLVGSTLTGTGGSWDPADVSLTYQWLASGVEIAGATSTSYVLTPAEDGKQITFRATASKSGYTSTAATSNPTPLVTSEPAPDTTITSGPAEGSRTRDPTATFKFTASLAGSTFKCQIDTAAWVACASPWTTPALPEGAHTVRIRARSSAGVWEDAPAERRFTVDLTPPDTTISSGPGAGTSTNDTTPAFGFKSTETSSSFLCRVDDASAWTPCGTPLTLNPLTPGRHTFRVRAKDSAATSTRRLRRDPSPSTPRPRGPASPVAPDRVRRQPTPPLPSDSPQAKRPPRSSAASTTPPAGPPAATRTPSPHCPLVDTPSAFEPKTPPGTSTRPPPSEPSPSPDETPVPGLAGLFDSHGVGSTTRHMN